MSPTSRPTKIGILGCGVISGIYIENSKKLGSSKHKALAKAPGIDVMAS